MNSKRRLLTLVKLVSLPDPIGTRAERPRLNVASLPGQEELSAPSAPSRGREDGARRSEDQPRTMANDKPELGQVPAHVSGWTGARPAGNALASAYGSSGKPARVVVDFGNTSIVKGLAKRLKREVRSWGDLISHYDALTIVSRIFGHDGYEELYSRIGLADRSEPDRVVDRDVAEKRYRQYATVLTENDFSIDEAEHLLKVVTFGSWWDFSGERSPPKAHGTRIRVANTKTEFLDLGTVVSLFGIFEKSIHAQGLVIEEGRRHLFAKMFGHATFKDLCAAAGRGNPSVPDFYLAPESLDERVRGYLEVLSDAGIGESVGLSVLREGFGGWLGIEDDEWESLRQPRHVDQIQHGRRPRWRPRRC